MTAGVTPDAVDRIGLSLAAQLDAVPPQAFKAQPPERLGAILNYSTSSTRDELLASLEQEDAAFAEAVRKSIFTFANIPQRLKATDVPKITRDVPPDVLATAIAGATSDEDRQAVDFILGNMSRRMADNLREEADAKGAVKQKVAEKAMTQIVNTIRELVNGGEIEFRKEEEDEQD
jgi:flagellar motor switch protein FliG